MCIRDSVGGHQVGIGRAALDELLVWSMVNDATVGEENDVVGERDGRHPRGDDQDGGAGSGATQGGENLLLHTRIDGRGGVVEDEQTGVCRL